MAADFDTGGTTRQTLTVGTLYKTIAFFQFDKIALFTVHRVVLLGAKD
jgi:hypothetical protein